VAVEFDVPADYDGQRLDRLLVSMLAEHSRSQLQRLITEGCIRVRGTVALKPNTIVHGGDHVEVDVPPPQPSQLAAEPVALDILFQDEDVAVLNKPAGMVVHPGAGHASGTLVNALLHHMTDLSGIGGELRPGIVHRLDRGTSGVMVAAKNDAAHQELSRQFHDREVEKEYIALVWGLVQAGKRIDAAIGRDPNDRQKMSTRARRARSAVTRVTWALNLRGVSLIHVAIHTGRTHQIRVHLSSIGHPIVGDPTYGGVHRHVGNDVRAVQRLERPFLHAARLKFTHPTEGRVLEFESSLPRDLQSVLDDLHARQDPASYKRTGEQDS